MKGFIINLDRSKDRLITFEERILALGFEKVSGNPLRWQKGTIEIERLPSVEGKKLSFEEIERYRAPHDSAFWDWTTHQLTLSEIGCYLSHYHAWEKVINEKLAHAFILEDDMIFSPDILEFLADESWIPQDADFVKLDFLPVDQSHRFAVSAPIAMKNGREVVFSIGRTYGAGCYILTNKVAQQAIDASDALRLPVDLFLFDARYEFAPNYKMYCVFPALAIADMQLESTIGSQRYKDPLTLKQHCLKGCYSLMRRWRLKKLMKENSLHWEEKTYRA